MLYLGLLLLAVAGVLVFLFLNEKKKLGLMQELETSAVGDLYQKKNELVELKGTLECNETLTSELAQKPCAYYKSKVVRESEETYYEKDSEGKSVKKTRKIRETVSENERKVPIWLKDSTGKVALSYENAELVTEKVLSKFDRDFGNEDQAKIKLGKLEIKFSTNDNSDRRRLLGYQLEEEILAINQPLYVLGEVKTDEGNLIITKPTENKGKLIISSKSEEELMREGQKNVKIYLISSIALAALGIGATIASFFQDKGAS